MRILLVEDDPHTAGFIAKGLKEDGHAVDHADNGKDGLFLATTEPYDAIVLDRMLPQLDGMTLLKTLRGAGNRVPTLLLTALGDVEQRVEGLRAGADDYLVKPFAYAELSARLDGLARRGTAASAEPTRLRVEDLELDLLKRSASRDGKAIELQPREYRLLEYLMRQAGRVVTRTMLLEAVWDYHFDPQTNVIDVHISRLRQKIDHGFAAPLLHTVRGAGYRLGS
ncbi:response regulator transcription factor [Luteimonas gilva]|jgi:two-component system, OmpR family, response regulator|uniref:Response regulator transcription factor n=1 Tax=Luteimonas gilva TaxID=2572684 RepID=A0A4U5JTF5_9GAMM|nr:response regulator transcription factor [Luteimonas gilva]TKR29659.1 response regulator transcription factor [Luteimonas gilva]